MITFPSWFMAYWYARDLAQRTHRRQVVTKAVPHESQGRRIRSCWTVQAAV